MIQKSFPIIDLPSTSHRIRELRLARGYSVKDLQEYLRLESLQAIYHWESGIVLPRVDNLFALSYLYDIPMVTGQQTTPAADGTKVG